MAAPTLQAAPARPPEALLDHLPAAVLATDDLGRVVYVNGLARRLFALDGPSALSPAALSLTGLGLPATPLAHDEARREQDVVATPVGGRPFPALMLSARLQRPCAGAVAVHVLHDMTERQRVGSALRHSANLALLGRMSASLVHEISQPLGIIRLTAEGGLLAQDRGGLSAEDASERLRTISGQAGKLYETVVFIQTLSHPGVDGGAAAPALAGSVFDLAAAVRDAVAVVRDAFGRAGVGLEVITGSGRLGTDVPCPARGRTRPAEQVAVNLLTNALQAAHATRGTAGRVRIELVRPAEAGRQPVVRVEDNGPGVPDDLRASIFEPFFTTKAPTEGTGLGLTICASLMASMGGRLTVGRSPLGGARFEVQFLAAGDHAVRLPPRTMAGLASGPALLAGALPPESLVGTPVGGLRHILIAHPDPGLADAYALHLGSLGFVVSRAADVAGALGLLAASTEPAAGEDEPTGTGPVEAVIAATHLPGGGETLLEAIAEAYPQVFAIALQPVADGAQADRLHADAVLAEPLPAGALADRLIALLAAAV